MIERLTFTPPSTPGGYYHLSIQPTFGTTAYNVIASDEFGKTTHALVTLRVLLPDKPAFYPPKLKSGLVEIDFVAPKGDNFILQESEDLLHWTSSQSVDTHQASFLELREYTLPSKVRFLASPETLDVPTFIEHSLYNSSAPSRPGGSTEDRRSGPRKSVFSSAKGLKGGQNLCNQRSALYAFRMP